MAHGSGHTGIGLVAIRNGQVAVVGGIGEDNGADHAVVLRVLDLQAPEEATVPGEGDLAFEFDAELNQAVEVGL